MTWSPFRRLGVASRSCASSGRPARAPSGEAGVSGTLPPRNARLGRGGIGRVQRSGGRYRGARRAPRAPWPRHGLVPSTWQRPRPLQASRRRPPAGPEAPPAPMSSRTHNQPGRATGASGGGSTTGRGRPREPVHAAARRPVLRLAVMTCTVPEKPRWLLSIPDAIRQIEQLDRTLLTRRDIERLFGVSKVRAAPLMQTLGAEMTGNQRTLPPAKLLQQLRKHRQRGAFRGEEERRARLVAELQKARLTGVRFKVPADTMSAKLANLPEGFPVARGRIKVRFDGAEGAVARFYALAQALGSDYGRLLRRSRASLSSLRSESSPSKLKPFTRRREGRLWRAVRQPITACLAELHGGPHECRLGDGTTLAARWRHRDSFDIDLTVLREESLSSLGQTSSGRWSDCAERPSTSSAVEDRLRDRASGLGATRSPARPAANAPRLSTENPSRCCRRRRSSTASSSGPPRPRARRVGRHQGAAPRRAGARHRDQLKEPTGGGDDLRRSGRRATRRSRRSRTSSLPGFRKPCARTPPRWGGKAPQPCKMRCTAE